MLWNSPASRFHPLLAGRHFVMEPLAEIAPEAVHPVLGKTFAEILAGMDSSAG